MLPAIFTLLRLCPRTFVPASCLLSLSTLSDSVTLLLFALSLSAFFQGTVYILRGGPTVQERATVEWKKKEKIYWLQESPWFSTLVKLPRLRTFSSIDSHSFSPSPFFPCLHGILTFFPSNLCPYLALVSSGRALSSPRFLKIGRPDKIRSSPLPTYPLSSNPCVSCLGSLPSPPSVSPSTIISRDRTVHGVRATKRTPGGERWNTRIRKRRRRRFWTIVLEA